MLFSNPEVSAYIRENFVAAWESVRPVPIVEIDFGNGKKLKRTVNGNVATYICAPDGRVVDIIPGLNEPKAYLRELKYAVNLYLAASRGDFDKIVLDYHKENTSRTTRYEMRVPDYSKAAIERPVKRVIDADLDEALKAIEEDDSRDMSKRAVERKVKKVMTEEEKLLAADTILNLKERRPMIHKMLAEKIVKPADVTKRLYKEVLHVDLDDPYLGLVSKAFEGGAYDPN